MDLIDLEILVDLDYIGGAQCGSAGVRSISLGLESFTHVTYLSETSDPLKRTRFLPSHVEIMLAASGEARRASSKLSALAECFGMELLSAMAQHAKGALALAEGDARSAMHQTIKAPAGTTVFPH